MIGIVDALIRQKNHGELNKLPQIPEELVPNRLSPITSQGTNTKVQEAPQKGASSIVYFSTLN
jgi:hypothetical protein